MMRLKEAVSLLIVVAVTAVIAGCSTTSRTIPRYAWETAQEEEYATTFRGRWWSYYDRGLWNELRGNYEEAEADFLAARARRADDQLWPRTYGLHFLPEYFPNRELGITYYHMGRYEESVALLEKSLEQQYSARAGYYVDLARSKHIEARDLDTSPPSFLLIRPSPDEPTAEVYAEMFGEARDDTYVKEIYVNGDPVDVRLSEPVVRFRHRIALGPGENRVAVRVVDLSGKRTTTNVVLMADHEGPVVSFNRYDGPARAIEGLLYDPAGVRSLVVAGEQARLEDRPDGTLAFRVRLARAAETAELPYRCEDANGNVTQGYLQIRGDTIRTTGGGSDRIKLAGAAGVPVESREVGLTRSTSTDPDFRAVMVNLDDAQRFYQPTITVTIQVSSPAPVESVEFNGESLSIIPAQRVFSVSRTLGLGTERNAIRCFMVATNSENERASDEKVIYRELNPVETQAEKLSFAIVRVQNNHPFLSDADAKAFIGDLAQEPEFAERFGGIVVRDDEMIQAMLREHELAQLSSDEHRLLRERIETADVLLTATVNGNESFIEVVLEGMSTRVNRIITNRVEVAGAFSEKGLDDHKRALAIRLAQEFPRLQRPAIAVTPDGVYFQAFREDGIRRYYDCMFVEEVLVGSGNFQQPQLLIRGKGFIENAEREPRYSRARIEFHPQFATDLAIDPAAETYFVVTK